MAAILLLIGGALIAVAYTGRALITEQRSAAAQLQAGIAMEAAHAGIDWAVIQLNRPMPLDATCEAAIPPAGELLAAHLITTDFNTGAIVPSTHTGVVGCNLAPGAWVCDCAGAPTSTLPSSPSGPAVAGFRLKLSPSARPGTVQLTSAGCADVAAGCTAADTVTSRISLLLGVLPTLKSPPAATVMATGQIEFSPGVALSNIDPHTHGLLAAAGGLVTGTPAITASLAGTPLSLLLQSHTASLQSPGSSRLFQQHVGLDATRWAELPSVTSVQCEAGNCAPALSAAQFAGARLIRIEGGFELDGQSTPQVLGSADVPLFIVATGPVIWRGAVRFTGVLVAPSLDWHPGGTQRGAVHGALVLDGDARLLAPADIAYDTVVMNRLRRTGTLVPVAGSWRDF